MFSNSVFTPCFFGILCFRVIRLLYSSEIRSRMGRLLCRGKKTLGFLAKTNLMALLVVLDDLFLFDTQKVEVN